MSASVSTAVSNLQAAYAAFGAHDFPKVLSFFDDRIEWDHNQGPVQQGPFPVLKDYFKSRTGLEEVRGFFELMDQTTQVHKLEPLSFLTGTITSDGVTLPQVAVVVSAEQTVKDTGKKMQGIRMHLFTFNAAGTKAIKFDHHYDTYAFVLAFSKQHS